MAVHLLIQILVMVRVMIFFPLIWILGSPLENVSQCPEESLLAVLHDLIQSRRIRISGFMCLRCIRSFNHQGKNVCVPNMSWNTESGMFFRMLELTAESTSQSPSREYPLFRSTISSTLIEVPFSSLFPPSFIPSSSPNVLHLLVHY